MRIKFTFLFDNAFGIKYVGKICQVSFSGKNNNDNRVLLFLHVRRGFGKKKETEKKGGGQRGPVGKKIEEELVPGTKTVITTVRQCPLIFAGVVKTCKTSAVSGNSFDADMVQLVKVAFSFFNGPRGFFAGR